MYSLKKIRAVSSASVSALAINRAGRGAKPRARSAIDVRNPRLLMGLVFVFLLLAYLTAYAQETAASSQPYLVIRPPANQVVLPSTAGSEMHYAQPEQPWIIPQTGQ